MHTPFKYAKKIPLVLPLISRRGSRKEQPINRVRVDIQRKRKRAATEDHHSSLRAKLDKIHFTEPPSQIWGRGRIERLKSQESSPKEQIFKILNSIIGNKSEKCFKEDKELPLRPLQISTRNHTQITNKQKYFTKKIEINNQSINQFEQYNLNSKIFKGIQDCKQNKEYFCKANILKNKLKAQLLKKKHKKYPSINIEDKNQTDVFKNNFNYCEWRKLSMEKLKCPKYEESSFDLESERIQKYRSKNEQTLKKYFESKLYLNKLRELSPKNNE